MCGSNSRVKRLISDMACKEHFLLVCVLLLCSTRAVESADLLSAIKARPGLSEAAGIIERNSLLKAQMEHRGNTAFIPNNEAFRAYNGTKDDKLMEYHLVNLAYKVQDLPDHLNTILPGNPLLYVAKIPTGEQHALLKGYEDNNYYINNAKIIDGNFEATASDGSKQYLHILDQVIAPTIPKVKTSDADFVNPTADKLLLKPQYYGLEGQYSVKEFEKRVSKLNLMDVFALEGKNTFFIPVDQALNDLIDKPVVHGHVIPDHVLFTRTVEKPTDQFESMAFSDNLKVVLFMENVTSADSDVMTYYVKSNIVAGDVSHKKGTVLARIPKGNIPVKNGVVHLIDRPLMIVASTIISYLQEEDGQLSKFHRLMRDHYVDMIHELMIEKDRTLFAPSNAAFKMVNQERLEKVTLNSERLKKLVRMHIVPKRLTTDEIVSRTVTQEDTLSPTRKLYFAVNNPEDAVPIVSLEGGGVNATITTPNIAAKNGVIHIIDRILGIPSQTVYEKLATDPMLSTTFNLSEQNNWNERLKDRGSQRFTLFVPSNDAWASIRRNMASGYKKLFMGDYAYQGKAILERHMIVGNDWSIDELNSLTTNTSKPGYSQVPLNVTRGKIYFQARVREAFGVEKRVGEYSLVWNGISARVIRPDVECVNGVVHVIDKVLMARRDVTVSGSATPAATGLATLAATFVTVAFARALHR